MVDSDFTALVIGGTADSGRELVRTVAEAGGTVGFTYNSSEATARRLAGEVPGDDHRYWQCDVTDADDAERTVSEAFDALGAVDGLVYTVGVIARGAVDGTDPGEWADHLDANVTGAFNVLRAAAPHLKEQGHGAVVALSAAQGILDSPNLSAYDASKRGLEALIEETARELGPHGVRANVVAPGFIRDPDALDEDARRDLLDQQPYERITTPGNVADACLFLCSEDAATVTGAVLPVDAGLSL